MKEDFGNIPYLEDLDMIKVRVDLDLLDLAPYKN